MVVSNRTGIVRIQIWIKFPYKTIHVGMIIYWYVRIIHIWMIIVWLSFYERLISPIIIQYWMWPFSSIIGCFLSSVSGWNLYSSYNNYRLLDVSYPHFMDGTYMKQLSSLTGWFLPSFSGWNLYSISIIHCWMFLVITFWTKLTWYKYHPLLNSTHASQSSHE